MKAHNIIIKCLLLRVNHNLWPIGLSYKNSLVFGHDLQIWSKPIFSNWKFWYRRPKSDADIPIYFVNYAKMYFTCGNENGVEFLGNIDPDYICNLRLRIGLFLQSPQKSDHKV